jgi:hypothetical protein
VVVMPLMSTVATWRRSTLVTASTAGRRTEAGTSGLEQRGVSSARARARSWLTIAGGVLVLASGALAPVLAASGDKSQPEEVVRQYVQAALSERNDAGAAALTCPSPRLGAVQQWQRDLAVRESQIGVPLRVDVASYADSITGGRAEASVEIAVTLQPGGQPSERLTGPCRFALVQQDGWKVCAASQAGSWVTADEILSVCEPADGRLWWR